MILNLLIYLSRLFFSDDLQLFHIITTPHNAELLHNINISALHDRCYQNILHLNISKSKVLMSFQNNEHYIFIITI